MKSTFIKQIAVIVLGVLFVTGVSEMLAAPPACAPPGCNPEAPINKSNIAQMKAGGLIVGGTATINQNSFVVAAGKAGFNTGTDVLRAQVDINGSIYIDGSIYTEGADKTTATDALRVVRYLDNQYNFVSKAEYAAHDVDGNGVVNIADALIIMQRAVGQPKEKAEQLVYGSELAIGMVGDVNNDKTITVLDSQRALQIAAGTVGVGMSEYRRADVDGDGVVTTADAQQINDFAVGAAAGSNCSNQWRGKIILVGGSNDTAYICKNVGGAPKWSAL
ncbi:MAG: dockerin type I domain-containing protein [Patescibacteria group bacterium]